MSDPDDPEPPVPRLPRGRGLKFSGPELFRIALTLALLVAVIVLTKPCARSVSTFVMGFDGSASALGSAAPSPGSAGPLHLGSAQLIPLKGLTDQQVKETVEREQARYAGSATGYGSGSVIDSPRLRHRAPAPAGSGAP